jgi:hypothetical protein
MLVIIIKTHKNKLPKTNINDNDIIFKNILLFYIIFILTFCQYILLYIFPKNLGAITHNDYRFTTFFARDRGNRRFPARKKCGGEKPHKGANPRLRVFRSP